MKSKFISVLILLVCTCFLSASAQNKSDLNEYDVFLLIGQSNMAGRGYMTEKDKKVFDQKRNVHPTYKPRLRFLKEDFKEDKAYSKRIPREDSLV